MSCGRHGNDGSTLSLARTRRSGPANAVFHWTGIVSPSFFVRTSVGCKIAGTLVLEEVRNLAAALGDLALDAQPLGR